MTTSLPRLGLDERGAFASRIHGAVIGPEHARYDDVRTLGNRSREGRPAVVVRCADADDVAETIRFATERGLPLAVRAGGHSAFGSVDGGVVIDLRPIDHVRVDAQRRVVAIGGGALAGAVDRATHQAGLATTTPTVSTVGIAGFALSGGISHLTRSCGLAVDNLVGADVVLADGSTVRAGGDGDEDLLWALTGGGGNFGVVTELRMRLHPVAVVTGGPMMFPLERTERVLTLYRDWMPGQPDDISAFLALLTVPPEGPFPDQLLGRPACALVWCNTAPAARAEKSLAPFRAEHPALDGVGELPYPVLQSSFDAVAAAGSYSHLTGLLYDQLPDQAATEFHRWGACQPTPLSTSHLYPLDGAAARVGHDDTAWAWRGAAFAQMNAANAPVPGMDTTLRDWAYGFRDALAPYALAGSYANFCMDDGSAATPACYGTHAGRLAAAKRHYDPDNVFRRNQNLTPTESGA